MGIFVTDCEKAGGRNAHNRLPGLFQSLFHNADVLPCVAPCKRSQPVGKSRNRAAFLPVKQPHAHAECVHHLHEIAAELRVVVVRVAAVVVVDVLGEAFLSGLSVLFEPVLEGFLGV